MFRTTAVCTLQISHYVSDAFQIARDATMRNTKYQKKILNS